METEKKAGLIESPEMCLWLSVLLRAQLDAEMLFNIFQKRKGIVENHIFFSEIKGLHEWFTSEKMKLGSIVWICSLAKMHPRKARQHVVENFLMPIIEERNRRHAIRSQSYVLKKRLSEEKRKLVEAREKLLIVLEKRIDSLGGEKTPSRIAPDFICGKRFGAWTVQHPIRGEIKVSRDRKYQCVCVCGRQAVRTRSNLMTHRYRSSCFCNHIKSKGQPKKLSFNFEPKGESHGI